MRYASYLQSQLDLGSRYFLHSFSCQEYFLSSPLPHSENPRSTRLYPSRCAPLSPGHPLQTLDPSTSLISRWGAVVLLKALGDCLSLEPHKTRSRGLFSFPFPRLASFFTLLFLARSLNLTRQPADSTPTWVMFGTC